MIIAFKNNPEGVLLACFELLENPNSDLIFAKNIDDLKRKLSFSGIDDGVKTLGFRPTANCTELISKLLGKRKGAMFKGDPGIERYVDLTLRNSRCNPAEFVNFLCSCKENADALYIGKTLTGKKYYNYMGEVARSYHQLCMFSRPDFVNGILSVRIDSPHRIGDMFCRWLSGKNPDVPIVVIEKETAWVGNGRYIGLDHFTHISSSFVENLSFSRETNEVDDLWDIYYDSQMISNRRNKKHAKKVQPKVSSSISKMSYRDRYKIERGIANCTLDNFT